MKPNFKNIDIYAGFQPQNGMKWQKRKWHHRRLENAGTHQCEACLH